MAEWIGRTHKVGNFGGDTAMRGGAVSGLGFLLFYFLVPVLLLGCSDRRHRNPLDPQTSNPATESVGELQVLAGDGEVLLRWDYASFEDIDGYFLYRSSEGGDFGRHLEDALPPETGEFVDQEVENGKTYEYRLSLSIRGEGERLLDPVGRATPGTEVVWAADRWSGLIWRISPDGRSARFPQGRFPSIEGMDVDPGDGSCWVSDRFFSGAYRISPEGELSLHHGDVGQAGLLAIDGSHRRAWLVDGERQEVRWFELENPGDTLGLGVVDASFAEPIALAPQDGGCWIADAAEGRVLFFSPQGERVELRDLSQPVALAAGAIGQAWVLSEAGRTLVRLDRRGGRREVGMPFGGVSLAVDARNGQIWILGQGELGVFDSEGRLMSAWNDLPDGRHLTVDEMHGRVWIATREFLWKFSIQGETLARLGGFSGLLQVAVDPE